MTRAATAGDAEAITRVRIRGWQSAYAGIVPATYLDSLDAEIPRLIPLLRARIEAADPLQLITVAVRDGGIIGYANAGRYRINQERDNLDPDSGEVYAIYVDPPAQGTGAGRALMDASVAWLGSVDLLPARLWVLEGNARARAFYERYGFRLDGARGSFLIQQAGQLPVELPELRYRLAAPPEPDRPVG